MVGGGGCSPHFLSLFSSFPHLFSPFLSIPSGTVASQYVVRLVANATGGNGMWYRTSYFLAFRKEKYMS